MKEYQVQVLPERLAMYGVPMEQVIEAVEQASLASSGGVFRDQGKEYQIAAGPGTNRG